MVRSNKSSSNKYNASRKRKPLSRKGRKSRNIIVTIVLTVIPILIVSGLALSAYLTKPPELPSEDEGKTGVQLKRVGEAEEKAVDAEKGKDEERDGDGSSVGSDGDAEEAGETSESTARQTEQNGQEEQAKPAKDYKENFYTFLVTGIDREGNHTDTIMVVSLNTAFQKVNVVSVPRDSQVDVPREYKKINAAYAYGGTKELKKELQSILGFAPQYYIRVNLEAFSKVVDTVGGVEFNVPQDMDYDDPAQDLHVHLKKGQQLLDGDKALQLVRFRGYPNADIGRMQMQQQFLKALAKKVLSPTNIIKINTFVDILKQDVNTNLSVRDLLWFAQQIIKIDPETDISMQTLPSRGTGNYLGQNYLFLDPEQVVSMVNRTINPYTTDITLDDVNIIKLKDLTAEEKIQWYQDGMKLSYYVGGKVFGLPAYEPKYFDEIWLPNSKTD